MTGWTRRSRERSSAPVAEQVQQFVATIPAGTAQATPHTVPLVLDNWDIESIDLEVPPGPAGTMGFRLENNGVPWLPRTPGTFLVWDDHQQTAYPTNYPTASGWAIVGYNVGAYDHAVTVRFHVNPPGVAAPAAPAVALTFVASDVPPLPVVVL